MNQIELETDRIEIDRLLGAGTQELPAVRYYSSEIEGEIKLECRYVPKQYDWYCVVIRSAAHSERLTRELGVPVDSKHVALRLWCFRLPAPPPNYVPKHGNARVDAAQILKLTNDRERSNRDGYFADLMWGLEENAAGDRMTECELLRELWLEPRKPQ